MIWISSDTHFGHTNIIKYCNRPFNTVDEMDNTIINRFNEVIKPDDMLILLGDVSFRLDVKEWLGRLNTNQIMLVLGNHDHSYWKKRVGEGEWPYISINDTQLIKWGRHKIFCSHYSHRVWPESHKGALHCYGHSHGTLPGFGRSMDVGVDTNNFYPYSMDEVVNILSKKEFIGVDHHLEAFKDCEE